MLVEDNDKTVRRAAKLAEVIEALDRFDKYLPVEAIWAVLGGCQGLSYSNVEYETAELLDLVEQPFREFSEFGIPGHIVDGIQASTLLLPQSRGYPGLINLKLKKLALTLEEPCPEAADFFRWEHKASKPEYWTFLVFGVGPTHIGAYMSKLVEIGEVRQARPPDTRKPAGSAGLRNDSKASLLLTGEYTLATRRASSAAAGGWVTGRPVSCLLVACRQASIVAGAVAVIGLADSGGGSGVGG